MEKYGTEGENEENENEFRIEVLGVDKKTQRNVNEQRRIAKIFMHRILTKEEMRMTQAERESLGVVKYQYVYKNFLRDIKIYFMGLFQAFKSDFDQEFVVKLGFRQN